MNQLIIYRGILIPLNVITGEIEAVYTQNGLS